MSEKTERIGLVVIYDSPNFECLTAILQSRGEVNTETLMPQTWPGICQLTVCGVIHAGEFPYDALRREVANNIGRDTSDQLRLYRSKLEPETIFNVGMGRKDEDDAGYRYFATLHDSPLSFFAAARLHAGSGGFRLLPEKHVDRVQDATRFSPVTGIEYRGPVVMFPEELQAVIGAFQAIRATRGRK